ncbi:hypothetical protein [Streptomyces sp. CAU 1734]|uniref:hypothetical protein n=1 Tax=Streptomyces sp. CAU 1734 TaxID=3140360 RepID=UPI003260365C
MAAERDRVKAAADWAQAAQRADEASGHALAMTRARAVADLVEAAGSAKEAARLLGRQPPIVSRLVTKALAVGEGQATPTGVLVRGLGKDQVHAAVRSHDIPAIAGLTHTRSMRSLWSAAVRRVSARSPDAGRLSPFQPSPAEWGVRLQPVIAARAAEDLPLRVLETGLWAHRDRPWQQASPARLLFPESVRELRAAALLECVFEPAALDPSTWGSSGTPVVPPWLAARTQWQLDTLGLPLAYVAVLSQGHDWRLYRLPFEPEQAGALRLAAEDFLNAVARVEPPAEHDRGFTAKDLATVTAEAERLAHLGAEAERTAEANEDFGQREVRLGQQILEDIAHAARRGSYELSQVLGHHHLANVDFLLRPS